MMHDAYDRHSLPCSPQNYFLYTPLLPAVATGTMEERSIVEPVRTLVRGKVRAPMRGGAGRGELSGTPRRFTRAQQVRRRNGGQRKVDMHHAPCAKSHT